MKSTLFRLALVVLFTRVVIAVHASEVYINAVATTENGSPLAQGSYPVATTRGELRRAAPPSTAGSSYEPVAMYMLTHG